MLPDNRQGKPVPVRAEQASFILPCLCAKALPQRKYMLRCCRSHSLTASRSSQQKEPRPGACSAWEMAT